MLDIHSLQLLSLFYALFLKIALSAAELMLDYYLWDAVKDKCYTDKPQTIDALKDNIREVIGEIQLHRIHNMLKNFTDRVGYCIARLGSHLNKIIFHC